MSSFLRDVADVLGRWRPATLVVVGYLAYAALGWLLLSMPWMQSRRIDSIDSLFTAVSALSTTGLSTIDTGTELSLAGQLVVLLLIQVGGIGYMTFGSFVVLSRGHRVSHLRHRVARESFSVPSGMGLLHFLRNVVLFTAVIETAGTCALYFLFDAAGVESALWNAVFHSISAFCTAGFSIFSGGLEAFSGDFWVQATVAMLSLAGALGFIVFTDVWDVVRRRRARITLTTRIIVWATVWLLAIGTTALFLVDEGLATLPAHERLMAAAFQAMTATTTVGFNTVPIGEFSTASAIVIVALMLVGASPSGTGGGIKVTSVSALFAVARCNLRSATTVTFWRREVPLSRVLAAASTITFYLLVLFIAVFLLALTERIAFEDLLFEATSALGTVGLSRGVTAELSPLGQLTVILVMFLGRVGPLTIATALLAGGETDEPTGHEDVAV